MDKPGRESQMAEFQKHKNIYNMALIILLHP